MKYQADGPTVHSRPLSRLQNTKNMNQFISGNLSVTALSQQDIAECGFKRCIFGEAVYRTNDEVIFESETAHGIITVPTGYLTDFASIPAAAQGVFMLHDNPVILRPSVIHDFLYGNKGRITVTANGRQMPMLLSRQQADFILCHEAMKACGATVAQIATVYDALRVFGDSWGNNYPLSERFCL